MSGLRAPGESRTNTMQTEPTLPVLPAVMLFCIFMASITQISWPSATWKNGGWTRVNLGTGTVADLGEQAQE